MSSNTSDSLVFIAISNIPPGFSIFYQTARMVFPEEPQGFRNRFNAIKATDPIVWTA